MKKTKGCSSITFSDDLGKFLLRLFLVVAIFPHGLQKIVGVFGGNGLSASWNYFTEVLGISPTWTVVALLVEIVAPVLLILGVFTRVAAVFLAVFMAVAMQYHMDYGYFINWSGLQSGEGVEFHVLFIGVAIALVFLGGGRFSLLSEDRRCERTIASEETPEPSKTAF